MDMETLGTSERAIILTIGVLCVPDNYEQDDPKELYNLGKLYHLNPIEQEKVYNRTMNFSTIQWWSTQNPDVFKEQMNCENAMNLHRAVDDILHYLSKNGLFNRDEKNIIWSRGLFEVKLWEGLIKDLKYKDSIMFWQWRDSRTACDVLCGDPNGKIKELPGLNKHDPLSDCILDYFRLKKLGCFKKWSY